MVRTTSLMDEKISMAPAECRGFLGRLDWVHSGLLGHARHEYLA